MIKQTENKENKIWFRIKNISLVITCIVAVSALVLSIINTKYQFKKSYNLKASVLGISGIIKENNFVYDIVFINNGNQHSTISDVSIILPMASSDTRTFKVRLLWDQEPIVLKPGEMILKSIGFAYKSGLATLEGTLEAGPGKVISIYGPEVEEFYQSNDIFVLLEKHGVKEYSTTKINGKIRFTAINSLGEERIIEHEGLNIFIKDGKPQSQSLTGVSHNIVDTFCTIR